MTSRIEKSHQQIHAKTDAARDRLGRAVVPLLAFTNADRPEGIGSGVLLSVPPHFFLLTAAHVIEGDHRALFMGKDGQLVPLSKRCLLWPKPTGDHKGADIAVRGLEPLEFTPFGRDRFLTLRDTLPGSAGTRGGDLLILGHPKNKVKVSLTSSLVEHPLFAYCAPTVTDAELSDIGYDSDMHLGMAFRQKDSIRNGHRTTAPVPEGLSGAPLFGFNSLRSDSESDPLVGIATTWRKATPECIIGTDIGIALALIYDAFPECDEAFAVDGRSAAASNDS